MSFNLPKLEYAYDALEPIIDAKTMEIHHTKHHQAYIDNLNKAIEGTNLEGKSIEEICKTAEAPALRNNGGGHYNHSLFWEILTPNGAKEPVGNVKKAIENYGGFEKFKADFSEVAKTRFGSGWAWLCKKENGEVEICSTPNQDNPTDAECWLLWNAYSRDRCLGTRILSKLPKQKTRLHQCIF